MMITNHGIHQWTVEPGLQDTGGQNVFVNQLSKALAEEGFRITIVNRGGYPHPRTGSWQKGISYRDERQRIFYLEDDRNEFVRKEDMHEQIPRLVESLRRWVDSETISIDLLVSHYWDGAQIAALFNTNRRKKIKHIWVPHSLGILKKRNVAPEQWKELRIEERIAVEKELISELDGIAATSSLIRKSLITDYGYSGPDLFLPPCIETKRYHPRSPAPSAAVWSFLSEHSALSPQEIQSSAIITEISRTDATKGKDVLIRAFAEAHRRFPQSLLVVSIDESRRQLFDALDRQICSSQAARHIIVVGSIWELLPELYAVTDIYCTPARQESFGMSAQEAAATAVPVVASDRVPFVEEYLLGSQITEIDCGSGSSRMPRRGSGAIQVPVDDVAGFACALQLLLADRGLREQMGKNAYRATVPYFTWERMLNRFLQEIDVRPVRP